MAPPSTAAGSLLVGATHHSVGAAFVATYRSLGLRLAGYPVTEPYLDAGMLTQDFEHLRLVLRDGTVAIAPLGRAALTTHIASGDPALQSYGSGKGNIAPIPNTPTLRYFPQTHHTLQGDLLRFWQQHGGMAVFGAPITEVVTDTNGDGSGRSYQMQYFENARLERHPETQGPSYAILLGLLGDESLVDRRWLVVPE